MNSPKIKISLLLLALITPFHLSAQILPFDELLNIVKSQTAPTINETLSKLPVSYRQNYTLIHTSQGLQESSATYPRGLVFEPHGHLLMTFNGHPSQTGFESLETLEFAENTFRLREIIFKKDLKERQSWLKTQKITAVGSGLELAPNEIAYEDKNIIVSTVNPRKCLACHNVGESQLARPIWNPYLTWPGVFGQNDDQIGGTRTPDKYQDKFVKLTLIAQKEKEMFQAYIKNVSTRSRYKHLVWTKDNSYSPYYFKEDLRTFFTMPNFRITNFLALNNTLQIANHIFEHPKFKKYAPLYKKWFLCGQQPKPIQLKELIKSAQMDGRDLITVEFLDSKTNQVTKKFSLSPKTPDSKYKEIETALNTSSQTVSYRLKPIFLAQYGVPFGNLSLYPAVNNENHYYRTGEYPGEVLNRVFETLNSYDLKAYLETYLFERFMRGEEKLKWAHDAFVLFTRQSIDSSDIIDAQGRDKEYLLFRDLRGPLPSHFPMEDSVMQYCEQSP